MKIKYEFTKLKKNKLLMVFLCVICMFKLFELTQKTVKSPFSNTMSETYYREYIEKYKGEVTDDDFDMIKKEKQSFVLAEAQRVSVYETLNKFEKLDSDIVESQKDTMEQSLNILDKKEAFDYFYSQVEYAIENNRNILDGRGWQAIIEDEYIDIMLIVFLIVINGLIFVSDYKQDTYPLLISTSKGRKGIILSKIKLGLLISISSIILFLILNDIHYFINYSFQFQNHSMKDIALFKDAPYSISLVQALVVIRFLRIIGYLLVVVMTWMSMIMFKNFSIGSFMHGSIYIILAAFSSHEYLYKIPSPLSLIMGSGFLRGNEYRMLNKNTEWAIEVQTFFMQSNIVMWIGIAIFIVFVLFTFKLFYNRYTKQYKKIFITVVLFLFPTLIVGCTTPKIHNKYIHQNKISLSSEVIFMENNKLQSYDKSFNIQDFIKDPLYIQNGNIVDFYFDGVNVYFLNVEYTVGFQIYSYDVVKRKTELVYQKKNVESNIGFNFFQIDYSFFENTGISNNMSQFYVYNNELYFVSNNYLYKENMTSKECEMITPVTYNNIAFIEGKIYFCNERMDLECYNIKDKRSLIVSRDMIYQLIQYDNKLYYSKAKDSGVYCFDGTKETQVFGKSMFIYAVDDRSMYFRKDNHIYIYDLKLKTDMIIRDRNIYDISILDDDIVIVTEENNNIVSTIRTDRYLKNEEIL